MSRITLPAMLAAAAIAVGCAGSYYTDGYVTATAYTPNLIAVSPGVSVIADYHEPIFYSNNYYWRYDPYGRWYRSNYYDRGWIYAQPPVAVRSIRSPYAYRYYRPPGYTVRRGDRGRHYDRGYDRRYDQPVIRDHRH